MRIRVDWRPLTLDIPSYLGSARLDDKGKVAEANRMPSQWRNVRYAYHDAMQNIYRAPDSSLAGMGMLAARAHSEGALRNHLDRAFGQYWEDGLDIEDADVVSGLLSAAGVEAFEPDAAQFNALQESLSLAGVLETPAYLVDGDIFLGRAHLPMVRWILTGRTGASPI